MYLKIYFIQEVLVGTFLFSILMRKQTNKLKKGGGRNKGERAKERVEHRDTGEVRVLH